MCNALNSVANVVERRKAEGKRKEEREKASKLTLGSKLNSIKSKLYQKAHGVCALVNYTLMS